MRRFRTAGNPLRLTRGNSTGGGGPVAGAPQGWGAGRGPASRRPGGGRAGCCWRRCPAQNLPGSW